MCPGCPFAYRAILVWMDIVFIDTLDRANNSRWVRNHGHIFGLPSSVQLPGRHLSSLCQFGYCGTVLLYAFL